MFVALINCCSLINCPVVSAYAAWHQVPETMTTTV